jgi:Cu+-exporting ATPase
METAGPLTQLRVEGMTCNNCARHVTEASQGVPGVRSATISLTAKQATIRWNSPQDRNVAAVIAAITKAGYAARELVADAGKAPSRRADWELNLWLGVAVTALLMLGEWGFQLMPVPWFRWLSFGLGAAVQGVCGAQFYRGAWRQLKAGSSNMDTLVALGSTTAFGFSCWVLFAGAPDGHLFFMEAAAIISLISLGHWVEARVSERASGALKSLLTLAPATARRLQTAPTAAAPQKLSARDLLSIKLKPTAAPAPEVEVETPVASLRAGDLIVLKPGDRVPVDGVVTTGESAVDEAMLTGESVPVDKHPGGELYAGTVNLNGRLVMRVTATGEGTALARVIAAVQRAQSSRADIQRLGDRVSNVFVPVIVAAAVGSALWWGLAFDSAKRFHALLLPYLWHTHPPATALAAAFIVAAAVLIVACPCAMGLATPAAIMAAANAAARRGILIRDGVALEKAGQVTAVVFDKTGTLTEGKPSMAKVLDFPVADQNSNTDGAGSQSSAPFPLTPALSPGERENSRPSPSIPTLALAGALARNSTHPVSVAIAAAPTAGGARPELTEWQELRGSGVQAKWRGGTAGAVILRLGSLAWLREFGVDAKAGEAFINEWSGQGATIVGLAADGKLLGLLAVKDALKKGAAGVVAQLQRQGLKTYLLTGDNPLTAASVARQCGIPAENVFAGVRPEQKADFVKKLQGGGGRVAFVGDGINDAPALTQADLGIAVSRASDIAREAADIILLKSEIEAVPEALGLARATLRTIKQNLFWAFFYNALAVPLAATGFASPVLCAAAMGFSDLIVIGNALRLLRWK